MLRGLYVVEILVKDWLAAVQWYTDKLSLQVSDRDDEDQWCRLLFPGGGDAQPVIALWGRPEVNKGAQFIPLIEVDDIDATVAELTKRGVRFTEKTRPGKNACTGTGYRITTMLDCENNELQLICFDA
jgi:predicted enzyme related to lactoylglutathione lyase